MKEIWKDVVGYEGLYRVSNLGRVKSLDCIRRCGNGECIQKGIVLKNGFDRGNNYFRTRLSKNGKVSDFLVHRLVAQTFIPNPENKPQVNHKDGNKLNNCVDNLEWATGSENIQHAYDTGLAKVTIETKKKIAKTMEDRNCIEIFQYNTDGKFLAKWKSAHEIQRMLGLNNANIIQVCKGTRKTAGGFIWKYSS
ncbi:MAG: NUMOD4 domain-containing protein [Bacilli bacterium]